MATISSVKLAMYLLVMLSTIQIQSPKCTYLVNMDPLLAKTLLRKLVAAFDQLRSMSDDGQLSYPYSTRELAAIVKHMEKYPDDGIDRILRNVFDFDTIAQMKRQFLLMYSQKTEFLLQLVPRRLL